MASGPASGFSELPLRRGIIPQHIVARLVRTYLLLLLVVLGFCPHDVYGGQRPKKIEPLITPMLPAEQAWQVALPFPPSAPAAMDDSRVYIPLDGEHFAAIDRETGTTVWTVDIESAWPPLVYDGVVYLAASDELHALDAANGSHRWRVTLPRGAMAPMAMTPAALIVLAAPDSVLAFNDVRWQPDVEPVTRRPERPRVDGRQRDRYLRLSGRSPDTRRAGGWVDPLGSHAAW